MAYNPTAGIFQKFSAGAEAKALNAYADDTAGNRDVLSVESLSVTGDAEILGQLRVDELTPTTLGPYSQIGAVDFNFSSMSDVNVVSGKIGNVTITNAKGYFNYLTSGSKGNGYEVKFFGSANNNLFYWNGLKNYLTIKSNITIDLPKPVHTDSELHIAPQKTTTNPGALVNSIIGNVASGDFTGIGINPGDYIALADGNQYKILTVDASGTFLTLANTNVDKPNINQAYSIYNAGWYFDTSGNLIGEGYGYLQLPKADPLNDFTFSTSIGMMRYNQMKSSFEVYGANGWVPLAQNGYVTNKNFNTGLTIEQDPDGSGKDRIRFFNLNGDIMTMNGKSQISIGAQNPPNDSVKFYVNGDTQFDGTITGNALKIAYQASISGPTSIGSSLFVFADSSVTGTGQFGSNLYIGGSSYISGNENVYGSLLVSQDINIGASATISSGLFVASNTTLGGTLNVSNDVLSGGSGSFLGGLKVGSNAILEGSLSVSKGLIVGESATISKNLYVGSGATISDSLNVIKNLEIGQAANIASSLTVTSNASITGTLSAGLGLNVGQYASISGNLVGAADGSFAGTLLVGGDVKIMGSQTISSGLYVGSSATIAGSLSVTKDLAVGGSGTYTGGLDIGSNASIAGTLTVSQYLKVIGDTEFTGDLRVHGNIITDGTLISNAQVVNGPSSLTGPLSLLGDMTMTGSLTIGQSLKVFDAATFLSHLFVSSETTIGNSLYVQENVFASGSGMFGGDLIIASNTSVAGTVLTQYASITNGLFARTGSFSETLYGRSVLVNDTLQANTISGTALLIRDYASIGGDMMTSGTVTGYYGSFLGISIQNDIIAKSAVLSESLIARNLSISDFASFSGNVDVMGNISASYGTFGSIHADQISSDVIQSSISSISNDLSVGRYLTAPWILSTYLTSSSISTGLIEAISGCIESNLSIKGTILASSASITNQLTAATLNSESINASIISAGSILADYGSISSDLLIGGMISASSGSFTSSIYGSNQTLTGNISVAGVMTGLIGNPSAGTVYGPPNQANILPTDSLANALQKIVINQSSGLSVSAPLPEPNSSGLYLIDVRALVLQLDVTATYLACVAQSSRTVTNLCTELRPMTKVSPPLFDGKQGSLSAFLINGTVSSVVGQLDLSNVSNGQSSVSGFLQILDKGLFYDDGSEQATSLSYFTCKISPTQDLVKGSEYQYYFYHQITGRSNSVSFSIDDSLIPSITDVQLVISSSLSGNSLSSTTCFSGIKSYAPDCPGVVQLDVHDAISSHYYQKYGLALIESNAFPDSVENQRPSRDVSQFIPGSSQTLSLPFQFGRFIYCEEVSFTITAFNAIGQTGTFSSLTNTRIDTTSYVNPHQVFSGLGLTPSNENTDFGLIYDHSLSLNDIPELQMINGRYRVPLTLNFSTANPIGSPDYSNVRDHFSWRYATFKFSLMECCSNLIICIDDILGTGWGDDTEPATDMTLQIRVISNDQASENDSGWLDANTFYDGITLPQGNGVPCLLSQGTCEKRKAVSLGIMRKGNVYVRLGFEAYQDSSQKQFSAIHLEMTNTKKKNFLVRDIAQQDLHLNDYLFSAYKSGTQILSDNICSNSFPTFCNINNFFDGNNGTLSCYLLVNSQPFNRGSIYLHHLPAGGRNIQLQSNELAVFSKHDLFPNDPQKSKKFYCATASVNVLNSLAPGTNTYSYRLIHSITGSVTSIPFRIDIPSNPSFNGSITISYSGAYQTFSGVPCFSESNLISMNFTTSNCVSYFYNSTYGLASVRGRIIETVSDINTLNSIRAQTYQAFADVALALTTKFANHVSGIDDSVTISLYNCIGGQSSTSLNTRAVVDSLSYSIKAQVTSGAGDMPGVPYVDFGMPYNHHQLLTQNQELQLFGGKYQLPINRDFQNLQPSGPDYSNILTQHSIRYATFKFKNLPPMSDAFIKFGDIEGVQWGQENTLAQGMSIHIRLISKQSGCYDSGWLDCNAFFSGSIKNGPLPSAKCLLSDLTSKDVKHIIVETPVVTTGFIRVGLFCAASESKKFKSVRLSPPPCDFNNSFSINFPDSQLYSAVLVGSNAALVDVTQNASLTSCPTITSFGIANHIAAGLLHGNRVIDETRVSVKAVCELETQEIGVFDFIETALIEKFACPGSQMDNVCISFRLRPLRTLLKHHDAYRFYIKELQDCKEIKKMYSSSFYFDERTILSMSSNPIFDIDETNGFSQISGIYSVKAYTSFSAHFVVNGAVSNFYNSTYGAASIRGISIRNIDAITDGQTPISSNSSQNVTLNTVFNNNVFEENIIIYIRIHAPDSAFIDKNFTACIQGRNIRIDTLSHPMANHVKSGIGVAPEIHQVDFGQPIDYQESLLLNSELQYLGGRHMVPPEIDYTHYYPPGSPDYSAVNAGYDFRYATFEFSIHCISRCWVLFANRAGTGWGDNELMIASDMTFQIRVINIEYDTGWLDANIPYPSGALLTNSDKDHINGKQVLFGGTYSGSMYVRVGLRCSPPSDKSFTSIIIKSC